MRFLDTSFVVALFRDRERHHGEAVEVWRSNRDQLVTTECVLGEVWTFMRRREHHAAAVAVVDALTSSPQLATLGTNSDVHDAAWNWLRRRDEHEYSYVDAVSFEMMRRRRLKEALAFDGDFTRAGYTEVRPANA